MLRQTFLSPQVKRSVIITKKSGRYELPNELPNDCLKTLSQIFCEWLYLLQVRLKNPMEHLWWKFFDGAVNYAWKRLY